jgi:methionine aminotransferase
MAIYSFGKTFHTTGWKIGYLVAPPEITVEFRKVHQFNVFSANHPIQAALADYLADTSTYSDLNSFYQEKRDFFLNAVKSSRLRPLACEGTYFQLFDYSAISNENDLQFCKAMTKEIGVATIPVSAFFSNNQDDKVIRVCFAKTKEVLLDAAVRLCAL